jgi:hypothetical protein
MVAFHPTLKEVEHWILAGGLVGLLYNFVIQPFYRYILQQTLFKPAWDEINKHIEHKHPVVHAQFAHYHRRHEAPNPRVCQVEPCEVVP